MPNSHLFSSFLSRRQFLKLSLQSSVAMTLPAHLLSAENNYSVNSSVDSSIPLDVKIGQMLVVGFRGLMATAHEKIVKDIQQYHLGGVIFFDYDTELRRNKRNIESFDQLEKLITDLQSFSQIPLLTCIDYEGGRVDRLKPSYAFPRTYSAQSLGNKSIEFTFNAASQMAKLLSELGINLNFAPVVDLNLYPNNPIIGKLERSFSPDPQQVIQHALAFIHAHHQYGVKCTLKHFPGHGSSIDDSHLKLVDVTDTWSEQELEPYRSIIKAGKADAIMTAHLINRTLDPEYPATLSPIIINQLLRRDLNYNGVVFSDDIQMGAISEQYSLETALKKAIHAGVDVIIMGNNIGKFDPDVAKKGIEIIKKWVAEGEISPQRITQSFERIQRLKGLVI
jgi:beta-N-acetylhexosaminidase